MERLERRLEKHIELLISRYPRLVISKLDLINAYLIFEECYLKGGKLLVTGNGGSAADSEHIVGELMKAFVNPRRLDDEYARALVETDLVLGKVLSENLQGALPAIALDGHLALSTAYMNDCEPLLCFAQQINGFGNTGDVFWGISTSGNSKNILFAAVAAKAKGMKVVGLTGLKESRLSQLADVCIRVPETETYMIQELHLRVSYIMFDAGR